MGLMMADFQYNGMNEGQWMLPSNGGKLLRSHGVSSPKIFFRFIGALQRQLLIATFIQPVENVVGKEFMCSNIAWWTFFLEGAFFVDAHLSAFLFLLLLVPQFLHMNGDEQIRRIDCSRRALGFLSVLR